MTNRIKVTVDNRLRMEIADLPEELVERLKAATSHKNPDYAKKKHMGYSLKGIPEKIVTWREHMGELSLPRGCTRLVREAFRSLILIPDFVDERNAGLLMAHPTPLRPLRPHQDETVEAIVAKQNMLIRSGTGGGKTTAMIGSFNRVGCACLVIVHSTELANQWVERLKTDLGMEEQDVGKIQGKVKLRPVTIAMQKTLFNVLQAGGPDAENIKRYFGAVFADEVQFFAASTFFEVIDPLPAKYRVGASADERRKDKKDFLIADLFGEVAVEHSHEELVKAGYVMAVEMRAIPTSFEAQWYVDQNSTSSRGYRPMGQKTFTHLTEEMSLDDQRDAEWWPFLEAELALGEQVLILSHRREHCQKIAAKLAAQHVTAGLMLGSPESKAEFRETKKNMIAKKVQVGVGTYQALGTGIDIPSVGVGFAVTPIGANRQFCGQVRGRICRVDEGKSDPRLYAVTDPFVFGEVHHKNFASWFGGLLLPDGSGGWKEWSE